MIRGFPPLVILLSAGFLCAGPGLEDVVFKLSGAARVELRFAPGAGGFPAFFQKTDSTKKTILLSFLETETALSLGSFQLPAGSPVERVELKRLRSPSGRAFLGIEFGLSTLPKGTWEPKPKNAATLVFALDLGTSSKRGAPKEWSLAKAAVSPPAAEAVAPVPDPKPSAAAKSSAVPDHAKEPASETPAESPVPEKPTMAAKDTVPAAPAAVAVKTDRLKEIRVSVSDVKEEIVLLLTGKESPDYKLEMSKRGVTVLAVTLRQIAADSIPGQFDLGRRGWIRGLRWRKSDSGVTVVLVLDSALIPNAVAAAGRLSLAFPRRPGSPRFSWTSRKPAPLPPLPIETVSDPGQAAMEERMGELTSSRVFTVAGSGKIMMVSRDSTPLLRKPAQDSISGRVLSAGETVRRLGTRGDYIRVLAGADTGFIRARALAYPDELSASQLKSIAAKAAASPNPPGGEGAAVAANPAEPATPAQSVKPDAVEPPPSPTQAAARPKPGKKGEPRLSMPTPGDNPKVTSEALDAERSTLDSETLDLTPKDERVSYTSFGRRDPFIPVDQGLLDNGIDIDRMKVVGIVWEASEAMAVLEHIKESSLSFTVKQGDPVRNGRVARITREAVTFELTEFGISRSYTLKLVPTQERVGK